MPAKTKLQRDVTRALELAIQVENHTDTNNLPARTAIIEIRQILTDIDARTGRRDPSKRRNRKPSKKRRAS